MDGWGIDPEGAGGASLASCREAAEAALARAMGEVTGGGVRAWKPGDALPAEDPFPSAVMALVAAHAGRDEGFARAVWEVVDGDVAEVHLLARIGTRGDDAEEDERRALDAVAREWMVEAVALAVGGGPDEAVRYEDGDLVAGLAPDDRTPAGELVLRVAVPGRCVLTTLFGSRDELEDPTHLDVWRAVVAAYEAAADADPGDADLFHQFFEGLEPGGEGTHVAVMGS